MTNAGGELAEQAVRLATRADQVALCLDFDGTLSPTVADPEAARPLLGPLAVWFAAVALISGLPAAYLPSKPRRLACAPWAYTAAGDPRRPSRATRTGQRPHGRREAAKRCR
jgi:hypothetical protein